MRLRLAPVVVEPAHQWIGVLVVARLREPAVRWSSRLYPCESIVVPASAEQFWLSGETELFFAMIELWTAAVPLPIASPPPLATAPDSLKAIVLC